MMANHPAILALGYSQAAMLLSGPTAATIEAIISICGAREPALDAPNIQRRLILHFDDVGVFDADDPIGRYRAWAIQKWNAQVGRPLLPPTTEDARAIIQFAGSLRELKGTVLCQCQGGMSRSPAAALLCLATWTQKGDEQYCVRMLRQIAPAATPHRGLIKWGDQLIDRHGELLKALESEM